MLTLKSAIYYGEPSRGENDYVVLDGKGRVIGRIFMQPQAREDRPWFWTMTAPETVTTTDNRGYSATPEEAMVAFKARWAE